MSDLDKALDHLENAEATIMSWWARMDDDADEEGEAELPFATMLAAVLRSVSRAAGAIETHLSE